MREDKRGNSYPEGSGDTGWGLPVATGAATFCLKAFDDLQEASGAPGRAAPLCQELSPGCRGRCPMQPPHPSLGPRHASPACSPRGLGGETPSPTPPRRAHAPPVCNRFPSARPHTSESSVVSGVQVSGPYLPSAEQHPRGPLLTVSVTPFLEPLGVHPKAQRAPLPASDTQCPCESPHGLRGPGQMAPRAGTMGDTPSRSLTCRDRQRAAATCTRRAPKAAPATPGRQGAGPGRGLGGVGGAARLDQTAREASEPLCLGGPELGPQGPSPDSGSAETWPEP